MHPSSTELLTKGESFFSRGDFKNALQVFNEVAEGDPENAQAYFYMANIFHLNGELGKAIKSFQKVLSLDPTHTDASISLSVLLNDIGKYEEAKKIFDVANERVRHQSTTGVLEDKHINKQFAGKHFELAELYLSYQRYDEALFEYNKVVKLNPDDLEARVKIAKVYAKKGFLSKSFDELRRLKNERPDYMPARVSLGILHYGQGNILEAQSEWEKVLIKDPKNEEAAMYLNLSRTATETRI